MATELAPATRIVHQLTRTRRQIKFADLATRLLVGLLAAALFLMAAVAIDHWVGDLGRLGRWVMLVAFVGGALWYAVRFVALHALRAINPVYAARLIERAEPSLRNSLINYLLLREQPTGVHESVLRTLEQRAATDVNAVDTAAAVDYSTAIKLGYALAALSVLMGAYKILSPKDPLPSVQRLFVPWADIARPARVRILEVLPGDATAFLGDTVEIAARLDGVHTSDLVELVFTTEDGQTVERRVPMQAAADHRTWTAKLPPDEGGLRQSLTYRLEAGDAISSPFQLAATAAPRILVDRVEYTYPAYMNRPRRIVDRQGDLSGWEGTQVTLTAVANQPIRAAWIEFDPASDGGPPTPADRVLHLQVDNAQVEGANVGGAKVGGATVGGVVARQSFVLKRTQNPAHPGQTVPKHTSYLVRFETPSGRRSSTPILHQIEVLPDVPPEVEILAPKEPRVQVPEDGQLTLEIRAVDPDFGLAKLALDARCQRPQASFQHTLFADTRGVAGPIQRSWNLVPNEHGLRAGDQLRLAAVARDNRPDPAEPATNTDAAPTSKLTNPPPGPSLGESRSRELIIEILPAEKASNPATQPNAAKPQPKPEQPTPTPKPKPNSGWDKNESDNDKSEKKQPANEKPASEEPPQSNPKNANEPENTKSQKDGGGSPDNAAGKSESGDKSKDSKPSNGNSPDGKSADGKSPDGNSADNKPSGGDESSGDESGGKSPDGKQSGGKQSGGKPSEGKQGAGKQSGGSQSDDGQSADDKPSDSPQGDSSESGGGKQSGGGSKSNGGQQSNNQQSKNQQNSGQQNSGEQSSGQQSSGKQSSGKPASGKQTGQQSGKPSGDMQASDSQASDSQASDSQSKDSQSKDSQSKDSQSKDSQAGNKQTADKQADGQPTDGKPTDGKPTGGKPTDGKPTDGKPKSNPQGGNKPTGGQPQPQPDGDGQGEKPSDSPTGQPPPSGKSKPAEDDGEAFERALEFLKKQQASQGSPGQSGAGQASKDQATPPDPAKQNADRKKQMLPDDSQPSDAADPPAPSQSKRQSDSQGGADGDRSGGGKRGGGQGAKQAGNDTAGSTSPGDDGAGQAAEKGNGDLSGRTGDQARGKPADQPRNSLDSQSPRDSKSGSEKGPGAQQIPGNSNSDGSSGTPDNRPESGPSDPALPTTGTRRDPPPGDERMTGGGGVAGNNPPRRNQPTGPVADGDAANLDYANRATDLVLDYLKDQKETPNPELLERLGWSADDLRKFVSRWEALKRGANEPDPATRRELSDSLRSLGLRPTTDRRRSVNATDDALRGNRDAGGRSNPPSKYQERFNAYRRGAGQ